MTNFIWLYVGSWDVNSGTHVSTASIFSSEPSPNLNGNMIFFCNQISLLPYSPSPVVFLLSLDVPVYTCEIC